MLYFLFNIYYIIDLLFYFILFYTIIYNFNIMAERDIKTRQEEKGKGKFNKKDKEKYNSKHIRLYERKIELKKIKLV